MRWVGLLYLCIPSVCTSAAKLCFSWKSNPHLLVSLFSIVGFHYIIDSLFQWRYCILQGWFPRNLPKFMAALLSQSLLSPSIPHTYFAAPQLSQPILYCTAPSLFSSSSPKQQLQHNIAAWLSLSPPLRCSMCWHQCSRAPCVVVST